MTTEEKFRAAVNVIRNLPKHGPVQPSNSVMLKFYAYFKQATEGPNTTPKPAFWDLVKKAKWDSWSKLGDMKPESAMQLYVDEFKKIVESVSSSNPNMDKAEIDNFYASVPMKDLELLVGPAVARSRPSSPVNENLNDVVVESLPHLTKNSRELIVNDSPVKNDITFQNVKRVSFNGSMDDEDEDEYFLDTIENSDPGIPKNRLVDEGHLRPAQYAYMNGYAISVSDNSNINSSRRFYNEDQETSLHLTKVVTCLQRDLEKVVNTISLIEQRIGQLQGKMLAKDSSRFSMLTSPSVLAFAVLFTWPVLLQLLLSWFRRRNQ